MGTARDVMHRPSMQSTVGVLSITLLLAVTQASTDLELMDTVVPQIDTQVDLDWIPMPKHVVKLAAEPSKPYFFKYTQKPAPGGFPEMMLIDHLEENRAMAFPGAQKIWVCPEYEKETITLYEQWRSKADRSVYYSWDVSNIKHYRNRGESITNFKGGDCDSACLKIVAKMIADQEIPIIPDWVPETCYPVSGESAPFPVFRPTRKLRQQMIKIQKNISALEPKIAELAAIQTRYKNLTSKLKALQMEAIGQLTLAQSPTSSFYVQRIMIATSGNPSALVNAVRPLAMTQALASGARSSFLCAPGKVPASDTPGRHSTAQQVISYEEWRSQRDYEKYNMRMRMMYQALPLGGNIMAQVLAQIPSWVNNTCSHMTNARFSTPLTNTTMRRVAHPEGYILKMTYHVPTAAVSSMTKVFAAQLGTTASRKGNTAVFLCGSRQVGKIIVIEHWKSEHDQGAYLAWRRSTPSWVVGGKATQALVKSGVMLEPILLQPLMSMPKFVLSGKTCTKISPKFSSCSTCSACGKCLSCADCK